MRLQSKLMLFTGLVRFSSKPHMRTWWRLCWLYQKAYAQANQGSQEIETMGKAVLAYQFVLGFLSEIQVKVAGIEGTFDQLWVKACFEKAKLTDLFSQVDLVVVSQLWSGQTITTMVSLIPQVISALCVLRLDKDCPQQKRGRPLDSQGYQQQSRYQPKLVVHITLPVS